MADTDTAAGAVWADPDTPALCLVVLAADRYGPEPGSGGRAEFLDWTPDTLRQEVADDTGVPPHPACVDRLLAAGALARSPEEFTASAAGFTELTLALAGDVFDPWSWRPPAAAEVAWAAVQARLLEAPPGGRFSWGPEVVRYVSMLAADEGFGRYPPVLAALGLPADPAVPFAPDLGEDPVLAQAAAAGTQAREADLDSRLSEHLADAAARLAALPLVRPESRLTAAELAGELAGLSRVLAAAAASADHLDAV